MKWIVLFVLLTISNWTFGWQTSVESGYTFYRFKEFNQQGESLLFESGDLVTTAIELKKSFWNLSFALRYSSTFGQLDYDGQTQSGSPLSTTTDSKYQTIGLELAIPNRVSFSSINFNPYILFAYSQWDREIEGTGNSVPLNLEYQWKLYGFGFSLTRKVVWGKILFDYSVARTNQGEVTLDLSSIALGKVDLELGKGRSSKLALNNTWEIASNLEFNQYVKYEQLRFRRGREAFLQDGARQFRLHEPESKTSMTVFGLGLTYRF